MSRCNVLLWRALRHAGRCRQAFRTLSTSRRGQWGEPGSDIEFRSIYCFYSRMIQLSRFRGLFDLFDVFSRQVRLLLRFFVYTVKGGCYCSVVLFRVFDIFPDARVCSISSVYSHRSFKGCALTRYRPLFFKYWSGVIKWVD